ncbi:MAG: DUF1559 domain-containing protein [Planctomycetia bacterium]|nr:DUF1559 domain-containing protein [Planctomycetia bacterium]
MSDDVVQSAVESKKKNKRGGILRLLKWCFVTLFALCFIAILYVLIDAWPLGGVTISPETTLITSPRTPDGKAVDYRQFFIDQSPMNIATDDNGFRVVARELGAAMLEGGTEEDKASWEPLCHALGLDPNQKSKLKVCRADLYEYYRVYLESKYPGNENRSIREEKCSAYFALSKDVCSAPQSEIYAVMLQWLKEVEPMLDIVARELHKDIFMYPFFEVRYPDRQQPLVTDFNRRCFWYVVRDWGRGFYQRAKYRLSQGDIDGAIADYEAIRRLGFHIEMQSPPNVTNNLVSIAISYMGQYNAKMQFPNACPTKEQWQRLADFERNMPMNRDLTLCFDTENYLYLDWYQAIANGKANTLSPVLTKTGSDARRISPVRAWFERNFLDWDYIMKDLNEAYYFYRSGTITHENIMAFYKSREIKPGYFGSWQDVLTEKGRSRFIIKQFNRAPSTILSTHETNRRAQCINQLQAINYAFQLYRADHGTYPPYCSVDAKGKPLHSWRVLILPYLGQEELYKKIKLDEPWDSKHNQQFHRAFVPFYQCPSRILRTSSTQVGQHWEKVQLINEQTDAGQTTYSVIVGPDTLFPGPGVGIDPLKLYKANPKRDVGRMVLVTERVDTICWMKPDDELAQEIALGEGINHTYTSGKVFPNRTNGKAVPQDKNTLPPIAPGIASNHGGGAVGCLCNGATEVFSITVDEPKMKSLVTGTIATGSSTH